MSQKKKRYHSVSLESNTAYDYIVLCTIILASAIVPLIVFMKAIKLEGILLKAWTGVDTVSDFFSYYKSQVLIICLVLLLVYLIARIVAKKRIELPKLFIPLGIYALLVLLSALFAEHIDVALFGFVDRYEGLFAILCYVVLAITAFLTIKSEQWLNVVLVAIFISFSIIAVLGLTQFYGIDFFQTTLGKKLILPKNYEFLVDSLAFTFSGQKIMYTTVYNPNYLGSFSALLLPVALGLYYSWLDKGGRKFIIPLLFAVASFVLFLGGMSRAGILGGFVALIIFIILFRKKIIKYAVHSVAIFVILAGVYVTMDLTSGGSITREFNSVLPSNLKMDLSDSSDENVINTKIKKMELNGNEIYFETDTEGLKIYYESSDQSLDIKDLNGETLSITLSETTYTFENSKYEDYQITELNDGFNLLWNDQIIQVRIKDGAFKFLTEQGSFEDMLDFASLGFENVRVAGKSITFETSSDKLSIIHGENGFSYHDENGVKLGTQIAEAKYTFKDEKYSLYNITPSNDGFYLVWNDYYLPFVVQDDRLVYFVKKDTYITDFEKPETFGFEGRELFASGRGYIWSRSIPLLKDTLILGNGPDTFTIYFPQNEIDGKVNFLGSPSTIVDKPHNWYLQIGIDTGVLSLISLLVFLAWYWFKGIFVFIKDIDGMEKPLGAAILCGVTGYLIAALFNDSTVSVAPVFWTLLGVGIAILYKYAPAKGRDDLNTRSKKG